MIANPLYGRYLDGKNRYSMGQLAQPVLTDDGWLVPPSQPATEQERMIGAAEIRAAFRLMLQAGSPLPEEVARDVAHWLRVLNEGRVIGVFVPLATLADGAPSIIEAATPAAIAVRLEIAASLEDMRGIPPSYVQSVLDALRQADLGRLAGLAAPFQGHLEVPVEQQPRIVKRKKTGSSKTKTHIQYLASMLNSYPAASARELKKLCVDAAVSNPDGCPFHLVRGDIALRGKLVPVQLGTFSNWVTEAKKTRRFTPFHADSHQEIA